MSVSILVLVDAALRLALLYYPLCIESIVSILVLVDAALRPGVAWHDGRADSLFQSLF